MDKMSKEQAANILDPETSREALRPYIYDPDRRLAVVEEACRVAAKVLRFVSNTEPITIDSSGWTDEEVESIKKMLHECGAIVQIPESILSAPPEWVSVKDRMPNKGENVLVFATAKYSKGWEFAIDRLEEGEKEPIWLYTHGWFEVTHWMPLPEPPQEVK